jgi:hypothetical protein
LPTTLALSREVDGKIRVTSLPWEAPKVILRNEVLEVRNVDGVLHIARKRRYHDDQCLSAVNVNIELFCAAARGVPQWTSWKKFWSGIDADLAAYLRALAERVRRNVLPGKARLPRPRPLRRACRRIQDLGCRRADRRTIKASDHRSAVNDEMQLPP